jgi:hypothetical protein
MRAYRSAAAGLIGVAVVFVGWALVGQGQGPQGGVLLEPIGVRGQAIYPAVEGWFRNPDGSASILVGYFNRNKEQIVDVPIGPNNRIEPGGPDQGQPTHFKTGRAWGVFAVTVPKDFGNKRLTWTLVANGHKSEVALWLNPSYFVNPFLNPSNGNTPPVVRFSEQGPELTGPAKGLAQTLSATVGQPVTLSVWASDKGETYDPFEGNDALRAQVAAANAGRGRGRGGEPRPDVNLIWRKYRGPGEVKFAKDEIGLMVDKENKAETTATFSAPGEYRLLLTANDSSGDGGGGDQCCWTSAHVRVNVK